MLGEGAVNNVNGLSSTAHVLGSRPGGSAHAREAAVGAVWNLRLAVVSDRWWPLLPVVGAGGPGPGSPSAASSLGPAAASAAAPVGVEGGGLGGVAVAARRCGALPGAGARA